MKRQAGRRVGVAGAVALLTVLLSGPPIAGGVEAPSGRPPVPPPVMTIGRLH